MKKKFLSITESTAKSIEIIEESIINLDEVELHLYTKNVKLLGIFIEDNKFLGIDEKEFVKFQDGISFELPSGERISLFRFQNRIQIRRIL